MNNFLKITLSLVVGLLLLVGLGIGAVMLLVNPNNFKTQIAEAVKAQTGRELVIEDDLKMTWYPDIMIKSGKMNLKNTAEFASYPPLAQLNEASISVKFLPLLSKNLEVKGIVLQGLTLNLVTNAQGVNNWDDLNKTPMPNATPSAAVIIAGAANAPKSALINAFNVGNLYFTNAQVNWQDLRNNQTTKLDDLTLSAENLKFNQAVPLYLSFVTHHSNSNNTESVKLNTKLTTNEAFDTFQFDNLQIQNTSTGDNIPNKNLNSSLNVTQMTSKAQTLTVKGLTFKAADLALNSDFTANTDINNPSFQGTINIAAFNPNKMLKDFAVPTPPETEQLTNFALSTDINASMTAVEVKNLMLTLNDTIIKGSFNSSPVINANLDINQLDLDKYLPPAQHNDAIATPNMLLASAITRLPIEQIRAQNFHSQLKIGTLKVHGLELQDVALDTVADKGLITNSQSIKLYQGEYTGKLNINMRGKTAITTMNESIKQLQLEPFLTAVKGKAMMRGVLNANAEIAGEGVTPQAFKATMKALINFTCENGAIKGVSLQKLLMRSKDLTQNTDIHVVEQEETPFQKISATATINQGILNNNNLFIKTDHAEANGKGNINLNTEALNYNITATTNQLQGIPLNIAVTGTLSDPKYTLDVSALLNEAKKKLDASKLLEKVQSEEGKAKLEHALEKLKPEEKEKLQKLAPKAEKFLKKLF